MRGGNECTNTIETERETEMAVLPHEIAITTHRRKIAFPYPNRDSQTERLGFFHKWTTNGTGDYALVEMTDGKMTYIRCDCVRFLPVDDEMLPSEMEKAYRQMGLLKGE